MGSDQRLRAGGAVRGGLLAGLLLAACHGTPDLYPWAGYESSVADVCLTGGLADLDAQIAALVRLLEQAAETSRRVPPGVHAHLGYLYYLKGDVANAVAGFEAEKEAYPESAVFVDGLMSRIRTPGS